MSKGKWDLVAMARGSKGFHRIVKDPTTGTIGCTCVGFIYNKHCKHMDAYERYGIDGLHVLSPAAGMAELLGNPNADKNRSSII